MSLRSGAPRTAALSAAAMIVCAAPAGAQEADPAWTATRYELSLPEAGDAWHLASVEAGLRRARLTPVARVSWASRFGAESVQLEADLYPALPGVGYAYLSAAASGGAPFPELRLAAEAYATLPAGFEASAGVVHMGFDSDHVLVAVGSASKYAGNYWLSVRPSWTTSTEEFAVSLIARRYLRSAAEHLTIRLLAGSTPEEIARGGTGPAADLSTLGLRADGQIGMDGRWSVLPHAGLILEESAGDRRWRPSVGLGLLYRF